MRTTIAIDDELLAKAEQLTDLHEKSALVREALKALIEREAARRLARLGGTEPQLRPIPRRRPPLILVDTSIWVDHFRRRDDRLTRLLDDRKVSMHPFVAGELAVGNLRNRDEILLMLNSLPVTATASHEEALRFISNFSLAGRGLGISTSISWRRSV